MKTYCVETTATVRRIYRVTANTSREAECASVNVPPDVEEDVNEETLAIWETDRQEEDERAIGNDE